MHLPQQTASNHFDEYFIPIRSIHSHYTRLAISKNLFLPRVDSSSGKCFLTFVGPKVWSSEAARLDGLPGCSPP